MQWTYSEDFAITMSWKLSKILEGSEAHSRQLPQLSSKSTNQNECTFIEGPLYPFKVFLETINMCAAHSMDNINTVRGCLIIFINPDNVVYFSHFVVYI